MQFPATEKGYASCPDTTLSVFQHLEESCLCSTSMDYTLLCHENKMNYLFECVVPLNMSQYWLFKPVSQSWKPVSQALPYILSSADLCVRGLIKTHRM